MRFQKVSVDVWRMIITSGSCLFLAFMAWVLIKLAYACVWLPGYLKKQEQEEKEQLEKEQLEGKYQEATPGTSEKDEELKKIE